MSPDGAVFGSGVAVGSDVVDPPQAADETRARVASVASRARRCMLRTSSVQGFHEEREFELFHSLATRFKAEVTSVWSASDFALDRDLLFSGSIDHNRRYLWLRTYSARKIAPLTRIMAMPTLTSRLSVLAASAPARSAIADPSNLACTFVISLPPDRPCDDASAQPSPQFGRRHSVPTTITVFSAASMWPVMFQLSPSSEMAIISR